MGGTTQPTSAESSRTGSNLPATSPTQDATTDISEAVKERVTKYLRKSPTLEMTTTEEECGSHGEAREPQWKGKALKSGQIWSANTMVYSETDHWPHELVYGADVKPVMYEELTLQLCLSGYLSVLDIVSSYVSLDQSQARCPWHLQASTLFKWVRFLPSFIQSLNLQDSSWWFSFPTLSLIHFIYISCYK